MRNESFDSLKLDFAYRTARHDYTFTALSNTRRIVNKNVEAVSLKF
ncbi:MAG TPA: hypothetical protein VNE63_10560 [Candidatus Acidoferrales bacterium]|nr:hypothetical protein [Candidatus Acidoferrales bacterium]